MLLSAATKSVTVPASICDQLDPLSVERYNPKLVAANTLVAEVDPAVLWSTSILEILAPPVVVSNTAAPSCTQVAPPSTERNTPQP